MMDKFKRMAKKFGPVVVVAATIGSLFSSAAGEIALAHPDDGKHHREQRRYDDYGRDRWRFGGVAVDFYYLPQYGHSPWDDGVTDPYSLRDMHFTDRVITKGGVIGVVVRIDDMYGFVSGGELRHMKRYLENEPYLTIGEIKQRGHVYDAYDRVWKEIENRKLHPNALPLPRWEDVFYSVVELKSGVMVAMPALPSGPVVAIASNSVKPA